MASEKRKQLYSLTDEHREKLPDWTNQWIANAMSTAPMDREKVHAAVLGLYRAAKLSPPKHIVFVPSPLVLCFAGGFAAAIWYRHWQQKHDATDAATRAAIDAATRDATLAATLAAIDAATYAATLAATIAAIDAATHDTTRDATEDATYVATRAATEAATEDATYGATRAATYGATRAATYGATYGATRDATLAAIGAATRDASFDIANSNADNWYVADVRGIVDFAAVSADKDMWLACARGSNNMWQGGNQWSGSCSFLGFFWHIVGLTLPEDYLYWEAAAQAAGPRIMHKDFCMISDRPERLLVDEQNRPHCDTGPFCRWRDGFALYAVHGTRVPWWVIERPGRLTVERIEAEKSTEIRSVMLDKFGWQRYIAATGMTPRDSRENVVEGTLEALYCDKRGQQRLIVTCPTGRLFALGVPAQIETCEQAQTWLAGDDDNVTYRVLART